MNYTHDCNTCTYLGSTASYDLYVHTEGWPTYIARWGDEGSEYLSGNPKYLDSEILNVAHKMAKIQGVELP